MLLGKNVVYKLITCIVGMMCLMSCVDEQPAGIFPNGTYLSFSGINTKSGSTHPGDSEDYIVQTLRILAFDKTSQRECKSNILYNTKLEDIIHHPIDADTYDFVFIANEPRTMDIESILDGILVYADLNDIAFPASVFASDLIIPMLQEIDDVEVFSNGTGASVNGAPVQSVINLALNRMGARIDVDLKAQENLDASFTGITLNGIPDKVPLTSNYTGTINRDVMRLYTIADDGGYFSQGTLTTEDSNNGLVWAKHIARLVIPSNEFSPNGDETSSIELTVNLENKYNPSCKLKIGSAPDNYTLPKNTKLDISGIIKLPLELNIVASKWDTIQADWVVEGNQILNVSHIKADITDLNGVRISFSSNMPVVRVLESVYLGATGTSQTAETNIVFNDLAVTDGSNSSTRFSYSPGTGSGCMDILADGGLGAPIASQTGIYRLILSAENSDGSNPLKREIIINVTQNGLRFNMLPWGGGYKYVGAFFKNNQKGERIITGQHIIGKDWSAWTNDDFIILSSTPSFDPKIGTDSPGLAEHYPVTTNTYKNEDGRIVTGKGRIYFRIGMKNENPHVTQADGLKKPRYGMVIVQYYPGDWGEDRDTIYVRQGEDADYILEHDDVIGSGVFPNFEPLRGQNRTAAVRFATRNLTAPSYNHGIESDYVDLDPRGAEFTNFPSQAGALFQFALPMNINENRSYRRRAFHPTRGFMGWGEEISNMNPYSYLMWKPDAGSDPKYIFNYSDEFETSPTGYRRPTDGPMNTISYNGPYPSFAGNVVNSSVIADNIAQSELRVSLFLLPYSGNANEVAEMSTVNPPLTGLGPGTYPIGTNEADSVAARGPLGGTAFGFYSDGFFDRRPILRVTGESFFYNVAPNTVNVAYPGLLFYNRRTKSSLFLPSGGRLNERNGITEARGSTGYYWSASVGPDYSNNNGYNIDYGLKSISNGAWSMETGYYGYMIFKNMYTSFGMSIRSVKDE